MMDANHKLPLEARYSERVNPETGLVERLPTLHHAWISEINFLPYCPPNYLQETTADSAAHVRPHQLDPVWVEGLEMMDSDLHWLLQQPHASFWCQVMFDNSLQKFLDSHLRYATRSFDSISPLPPKVQEILRNIHRRVFMVFLRMSVNKESPDDVISPEVYSSIIYDRYLFDIPKLMDLCVLYGVGNKTLLSKMVSNVFDKQPQYHQDWSSTVEGIGKILDKISKEVLDSDDKAVRLDQSKTLSPSKFSDLVLYIADIADSLSAFVDVFPPSCYELAAGGFTEQLVLFYEVVVPELQSQWHLLKKRVDNQHHVKTRFRQLKHNLAKLVHSILQTCHLSPQLLPASKPAGDRESNVDGFVSLVTTILSEKSFLKEFEKHFSLTECVKNMQQTHPDLPAAHFDYILSAMGSSQPPAPTDNKPPTSGATPGSNVSQLSLVTHIKDLLPHLGTGFIKACLKEYGNDTEKLVNHVLEGNLPPHLKEMDFTLEEEETLKPVSGNMPPKAQSQNETSSESLLEQRANVFDNDEFDVFRRKDVDLSRVHIGKKHNPDSLSSVLDDKSVIDASRERYKAYEIETQWSYMSEEEALQLRVGGEMGVANSGMLEMLGMSSGMQFDQYNDEYDDTYDSQNVGAADHDSEDELISVQRLNPKGLFSWQFNSDDTRESGDEGTDSLPGPPMEGRPPPIILKRSEGGRDRGAGGRTTDFRSGGDTRGQGAKAKGHHHRDSGQDSVRSRQAKERHKGSRANHNRKAGAEWKRNKGMAGAPARF